jgi:hypothetical protein
MQVEANIGIMTSWPNILLQEIQESLACVLRDGLLLSSKEQVLNMVFATLLGRLPFPAYFWLNFG